MKLRGLAAQLEDYLKSRGGWIHKGEIQGKVWRNHRNGKIYIPDNVGVTLRKLQRMSIIAVKDDEKSKSVVYKWIAPIYRKDYIPVSDRNPGEEHILLRSVLERNRKSN